MAFVEIVDKDSEMSNGCCDAWKGRSDLIVMWGQRSVVCALCNNSGVDTCLFVRIQGNACMIGRGIACAKGRCALLGTAARDWEWTGRKEHGRRDSFFFLLLFFMFSFRFSREWNGAAQSLRERHGFPSALCGIQFCFGSAVLSGTVCGGGRVVVVDDSDEGGGRRSAIEGGAAWLWREGGWRIMKIGEVSTRWERSKIVLQRREARVDTVLSQSVLEYRVYRVLYTYTVDFYFGSSVHQLLRKECLFIDLETGRCSFAVENGDMD